MKNVRVRYAPSPTGFLHTGSLFTSMICQKLANQSNGVFYIRLEDTDTKREIKGSEKDLIFQLKEFLILLIFYFYSYIFLLFIRDKLN